MEINDKIFEDEVIKSKKPVLVMFWGSWCPVCKQSEPMIKELEKEIKTDMIVKKINIDRNPKSAVKYNIKGTPTFWIFKNGNPVDMRIGSHSKDQIKNFINNVIK